jgi:hypothetical protein
MTCIILVEDWHVRSHRRFGSAHHLYRLAGCHITNRPAARAHGRFGAVTSSHLGRVGLNLMLAFPAPHDQPDACGGSVAERHRRAATGFHRDNRPFRPSASLLSQKLGRSLHDREQIVLGFRV